MKYMHNFATDELFRAWKGDKDFFWSPIERTGLRPDVIAEDIETAEEPGENYVAAAARWYKDGNAYCYTSDLDLYPFREGKSRSMLNHR